MPATDIKNVLETKPVTFTLKTGGGKWKCTLHSDRAAYERGRTTTPGMSRASSDLSVSSSSSASASVNSSH